MPLRHAEPEQEVEGKGLGETAWLALGYSWVEWKFGGPSARYGEDG